MTHETYSQPKSRENTPKPVDFALFEAALLLTALRRNQQETDDSL